MSNTSTPQEPTTSPDGSRDGTSSGDQGMPYLFGRRPRVLAPFPFPTRQFERLVVLRGRVQDRPATGDHTDDVIADRTGWRRAAS